MNEKALTKTYEDTRSLARCRFCSKAIAWYETVGTGRKIPFDADAVVLKTDRAEDGRQISMLDPKDCHFVTCAENPNRN